VNGEIDNTAEETLQVKDGTGTLRGRKNGVNHEEDGQ